MATGEAPPMQSWPRDAWYVACTPDEIAEQAARAADLRRAGGVVSR